MTKIVMIDDYEAAVECKDYNQNEYSSAELAMAMSTKHKPMLIDSTDRDRPNVVTKKWVYFTEEGMQTVKQLDFEAREVDGVRVGFFDSKGREYNEVWKVEDV